MATVRIQVRRGTAAQWTSADPILEAGELGLESDTNYIKFGDGESLWSELGYANDPGFLDLTNSLVNYIELSDIGAQSGVAGLDSNKNLVVPGSSIIVEGSTDNAFETIITVNDPTQDRTITFPNASGIVALTSDITALIDGAPEALNTLNELAAALNDDASYASTITTALGNKQDKVAGVGDTEFGRLSGITSNVQTQLDGKQAVVANVSSTEIGYLDGVTSSVQDQLNGKQEKVSGISNTEIGYLDGLTSSIQDQLDAKQGKVSNVSDTEIGYLNGVTSSIQTQLDDKASASGFNSHTTDTTDVHGIPDTSVLATDSDIQDTRTYADTVASDAQTNAVTIAGIAASSAIATAVTNHENDTTNVHGISDTSVLTTASNTQTLTGKTLTSPKINEDVALTATATELNYVDGVTSAIQTQLNDKASTSHTHSISAVTDLQTSLDGKLSLSGGTMTGAITLPSDPSSALHAATKQYVDNTASGVVAKPQVLGATTTNIDATYSNGTAGVGATLTRNINGAFPAESGGASGWAVGKGILVKDQTNKAHNGRYFVSDMGSASTPYVLTRCSYCDEASEIPGAYIFVQDGTFAGTGWIQVVSDPATFVVGTDNIDVFQFSGSGTITAGTNISVNGNQISVVSTPSLSGVEFTDGTQTKEGVPSQTVIIQKTAAYTLSSLTERDDLIEVSHTGGSAVDITIPADTTLNFPIGTAIDVLRTNTGKVRVVGAGGVTVNATPGAFLRDRWSSATLFKRAANTWVLIGDLATA